MVILGWLYCKNQPKEFVKSQIISGSKMPEMQKRSFTKEGNMKFEYGDAFILFFVQIVALNAFIGFVKDFKGEGVLNLRKMTVLEKIMFRIAELACLLVFVIIALAEIICVNDFLKFF